MQPAHAPHSASGQAGFSLIQVVVILMISTMVLVSVMLGNDAGDNNQKLAADIKKLDKVEDAMIAFMTLNGRRPCPSDASKDVNVHEFGLEADNPGDCVTGALKASLGPDSGTGHIVAGAIPTKTLALPDDYAYDSWGRRFTYTVDSRATGSLSCYYLQKGGLNSGDIDIQNGSGTSLARSVYAYISHGPDGHGAFPAQGSTPANRINKGSSDADQNRNAGVDNNFTYNNTNFTNIRIRKDRTATFDDLLYYRNESRSSCCLGNVCKMMLPSGFRADGPANSLSGAAVTHGDLNGDGIEDLIIGATAVNGNTGAVFVVFGTRNGFSSPIDLSALSGTDGFRLEGDTPTAILGTSVAAADVNGDGITDLIAGSPFANHGGTRRGSVYVLYGSIAPFNATISVASLAGGSTGFRMDGETNEDNLGYRVAGGDVDGDGIGDLVMAAPSTAGTQIGKVYVVFGHTNPWSDTQVLTSTGGGAYIDYANVGSRLTGVISTNFGVALSVGDVNNNGMSDIVVGANAYDTGKGAAYVWFGRAKGAGWASAGTTLNSPNGTSYSRLDGQTNGDACGTHVATGDTTGSNSADILISCMNRSTAYLYFGKSSVWSSTIALSGIGAGQGVRFDGDAGANDISDAAVGFADLKATTKKAVLIGALEASADTGKVYAVYGRLAGNWGAATFDLTTLASDDGIVFTGTTAGDRAGASVTGADLNGDGLQDVIIGTRGANALGGYTYVYFGNTNPATPYALGGL